MQKKRRKKPTTVEFRSVSLPADAALMNLSIRSHWAIENNLHWNLDVIIKEDNQKNGTRLPSRMPILSPSAPMLNNEKTFSKSRNRKRLKAFGNDELGAYFADLKANAPIELLT